MSAITIPVGLAIVTLLLLATRAVRADGVAVLALTVAVATRVVPADRALSGFADPIVITIGALAVLAAAVHRSGIVEVPRSALARRWRLTTPVLLGSGVLVASLAAISGRVGTRASLLRMSRLPDGSGLSTPVMVLNLACLLGGTLTVVGGIPNLLVSAMRSNQLGAPFDVLAFLPVGAALLAVGAVLFILSSLVTRRDAASRSGSRVDPLRRARGFTTELVLPAGSTLEGKPVAALETAGDDAIHVAALVREGYRRIDGRADWILNAGDILVLNCDPSMLHRLIERFGLQPADRDMARLASSSGVVMVEAVITQSSDLIEQTPLSSALNQSGAHLLGIGRNDDQRPARLRRTRLRAGDILVLAIATETMSQELAALGCLLLTERRLRLGRRELAALPFVTLLAALVAASVGALPLWLALLGALLVLTLSRILTLREVYELVPWPGLVMLASLLPLATAVHESAASATAARALAPLAAAAVPVLLVAASLGIAMVASMLFGAVVAVLVLAPFALDLAMAATVPGDMLLMAVAIGASVDMLDPRGQIASLIPAPGRMLDGRWRTSLAVAALLFICGSAAIGWVWRA